MAIAPEEWLNPPVNVLIEPHVWVGQVATILEGVRVGLGSIIGAKSLVTDTFHAIRWLRASLPGS
jgi:acetyltransferase-like isoleucine patch superfamily enzyme